MKHLRLSHLFHVTQTFVSVSPTEDDRDPEGHRGRAVLRAHRRLSHLEAGAAHAGRGSGMNNVTATKSTVEMVQKLTLHG